MYLTNIYLRNCVENAITASVYIDLFFFSLVNSALFIFKNNSLACLHQLCQLK